MKPTGPSSLLLFTIQFFHPFIIHLSSFIFHHSSPKPKVQ
jgi:hypothetical protein